MHSSIPRIPFTAEAYSQMQAEYQKLLIEQEELLVRVNTARQMGDLSENGAYKYGKLELGNCRRRLRELKHFLKHGQVIQATNSDTVQFGNTVTLKNDQKEITFTLVSEYESDPMQAKLSDTSPMGSAVKGKKAGDEVTVVIPVGEVKYKLVSIQ